MHQQINDFHNSQKMIICGYHEKMKEIEKQLFSAIETAKEEAKKHLKMKANCDALYVDAENKKKEAEQKLREANRILESHKALEIECRDKKSELDTHENNLKDVEEALKKQKAALNESNNECIKKGRYLEMEETRLKALNKYIQKIIEEKNLKKEVDYVETGLHSDN